MDLDEEAEDIEALAELERAEEGNSNNDIAEEEDEVSKQTSFHFKGPNNNFFAFINYRFIFVFINYKNNISFQLFALFSPPSI